MRETISLGLKLLLITAIAGLLLGLTNDITKKPIAEQTSLTAKAAREKVLPKSDFVELSTEKTVTVFEKEFPKLSDEKIDSVYVGTNKDGEITGFVIQTTVDGFGGPIEIIIGVNTEGVITGINIGGSDFAETAGLGAKAKEPEFTDQFINKTYEIILKKANEAAGSENNVDAITAATKTSGYVVDGVNYALKYADSLLELAGSAEGK